MFLYYSVEKFRLAYAQLIPAMEDKSQWPQSCHGFFMHPPLLKATAGKRKTERYIGLVGRKTRPPKYMDGLGFQDIHAFNMCVLAKLGWRLIQNSDRCVLELEMIQPSTNDT